MQHRKIIFIALLVIALLLSGCQGSPPPGTETTGDLSASIPGKTSASTNPPDSLANPSPALPVYTGLNLDALGAYSSVMDMSMNGETDWSYHLTTRFDGAQTEYFLHIAGVDPSLNPGDVRLVTDGITSKMAVSLDNETTCSQFPSDYLDSPSFLTPVNLLDPEIAASSLQYIESGVTLDRGSVHYQATQTTLGKWENADLDVWLDQQTSALLAFVLSASREDPLFHTGFGTMTASYQLNEILPQVIEPVPGCETDLPIPDDATEYFYLQGIISYHTGRSLEKTTRFYLNNMPALGWQLVENQPASANNKAVLDFSKEGQTITINLETIAEGVKVTLFLP